MACINTVQFISMTEGEEGSEKAVSVLENLLDREKFGILHNYSLDLDAKILFLELRKYRFRSRSASVKNKKNK